MLGVSTSGYYAWLNRAPSQESHCTYGRVRLQGDLHDEDIRVSDKRVARLMRERRLFDASRRKGHKTTIRDRDARPAPDLVDRRFTATAPDQMSEQTSRTSQRTGVRISRSRSRCVQPARRWLANGQQPENPACARCARHGHPSPQANKRNSPFGPGLPVHIRCIGQALRRSRRSSIDGFCGAIATTTPCARVSTRHSSANCSLNIGSNDRHDAEITILRFIEGWYNPAGGIPRSAISRRCSSNKRTGIG